jgi:hypothetical protein
LFGDPTGSFQLQESTDTMPLNEEGLIDRVSIQHSVSPDAVRTILQALRSSGGSMAQFSHPDFGGMSQWSPGMSMDVQYQSEIKIGCRVHGISGLRRSNGFG